MAFLSLPAGGQILWLRGDCSVADHLSLLVTPSIVHGAGKGHVDPRPGVNFLVPLGGSRVLSWTRTSLCQVLDSFEALPEMLLTTPIL